jgi:N-acetylmuramoyl-L-alanine amidase
MVRQIQTKLKNWGYYNDSVDGIYGPKTVAAVRYFQSKNGLAVDGVAGNMTLAALGISVPAAQSSGSTNYSNDLYLLSRIISAEARGEPYTGQVAVGAVVLNRVKHPSFPKTLAGVIYQDGAFTAIVDGQINVAITDSARKAAQDAMNGWDPTYGCIYYYNPKTATNQWIRSRPVVTTIGNHVFCR